MPLELVMHVHDEAVGEVPENAPAEVSQEFEDVMAQVPEWATGLPVAVETWRGKRYRK